MKKRNSRLILASFCSLLLSACAAAPAKDYDPTQTPMLEPAAMLKFNDIPVPASFVFFPEESYAFQSAGFRAGLLKYKGKASGEQATVFFKEQMPLYAWQMMNIVEHGRRMLSFEKDQEACVITIDEKGKNAEITVSIAPKSHPAYRKADKPFK